MGRDELVAALAAFPDRLSSAARAVADRPVPDGEWSPDLVVRHLIAVEIEVHQARFADLDASPSPTWDWAEPGPWPGEPELTLEELLTRFTALRSATVTTIEGWDEGAWSRAGTHTTYGPLDVAGIVRNATTHDEEHLRGLG